MYGNVPFISRGHTGTSVGFIQGEGVGNVFGDVLGGDKMTEGHFVWYSFWGGGQMCSTGLCFH